MRENIEVIKTQQPSKSLTTSTLEQCFSEINQRKSTLKHFSFFKVDMPTPNFIWAAIIAIITISLFWFFPVLNELILEKTIHEQTVWVITIIMQNIIMLIFAPVILNKCRSEQKKLNYI